jgi:hypothetical protein
LVQNVKTLLQRSALGVLAACSGFSADLDSKASDTGAAGERQGAQSSYASQLEYGELHAEKQKIDRELRVIATAQADALNLKQLAQAIDAQMLESNLPPILNSLSTSLKALAALTNQVEFSAGRKEARDVLEAYRTYYYSLTPSGYWDWERMNQKFLPYTPDPQTEERRIIREIVSTVANDNYPRADDEDTRATYLRGIEELVRRLNAQGDSTVVKYVEIASFVSQASEDLSKFQPINVVRMWEKRKAGLIERSARIEMGFSDAAKVRNARAKQITTRLAWLDDQLRQTQNQQYQINDKLVWTIYAVIASVLVLFALLRVLPADLAKSMIDTRVLFETVSLVFLMVTLIILGIGDKIKAETLGTLLNEAATRRGNRRSALRRCWHIGVFLSSLFPGCLSTAGQQTGWHCDQPTITVLCI